MVVIFTLVCFSGFSALAKVSQSKSTQYLYDRCSDALSKNEFKDSYCETYIEAFRDGVSVAGYVMASEIHKNSLTDKIKSPSDCHAKNPENIEEFVKLFISWVDKQRTSTEIQYDVLKADIAETLGSVIIDDLTCISKDIKKKGSVSE